MSLFRQTTRFLLCTTIILLQTSCFKEKPKAVIPAIIPVPMSQQINDGVFIIDQSTGIYSDEEFKPVANFFKPSVLSFAYPPNGLTVSLFIALSLAGC